MLAVRKRHSLEGLKLAGLENIKGIDRGLRAINILTDPGDISDTAAPHCQTSTLPGQQQYPRHTPMDSQYPATKDDLYHIQMDLKHIQAVQSHHADRLMRLEKRQADDAALKSVWGNGSPFPSVLSGTPQHDQPAIIISQLVQVTNIALQYRSCAESPNCL